MSPTRAPRREDGSCFRHPARLRASRRPPGVARGAPQALIACWTLVMTTSPKIQVTGLQKAFVWFSTHRRSYLYFSIYNSFPRQRKQWPSSKFLQLGWVQPGARHPCAQSWKPPFAELRIIITCHCACWKVSMVLEVCFILSKSKLFQENNWIVK